MTTLLTGVKLGGEFKVGGMDDSADSSMARRESPLPFLPISTAWETTTSAILSGFSTLGKENTTSRVEEEYTMASSNYGGEVQQLVLILNNPSAPVPHTVQAYVHDSVSLAGDAGYLFERDTKVCQLASLGTAPN